MVWVRVSKIETLELIIQMLLLLKVKTIYLKQLEVLLITLNELRLLNKIIVSFHNGCPVINVRSSVSLCVV
jgi:hypothetical protein